MRLYDAIQLEHAAFDAIKYRLNEGVKPEDSKIPVLKLVQAYRTAVERRVLCAVRNNILSSMPPGERCGGCGARQDDCPSDCPTRQAGGWER